jgi:hypothetical protein
MVRIGIYLTSLVADVERYREFSVSIVVERDTANLACPSKDNHSKTTTQGFNYCLVLINASLSVMVYLIVLGFGTSCRHLGTFLTMEVTLF